MRAVVVERLDGPRALAVREHPEPAASDRTVLIDVHAAGVTFPDVLQSQGRYQTKPDLPYVLGSEVAGVVRQAPAASGLRVGDRVAAIPFVGGFAEQVTVDADNVFLLPDQVSFAAAATLPMNYFTAHFAFCKRGRLQPGQTVLVHGAAGGLGSVAVQYARALGAQVIAVVSTEAKAGLAKRSGANHVVMAAGFRETVSSLTDGRGVDVVFDPVGGDRLTDSLRSLGTEGRLLIVGFAGGDIPTIKANRLLLNNLDVIGVGWGAYAAAHPGYFQEQWREIRPLLKSGRLQPVVGGTYPISDAPEAVDLLAQRRAVGNIVITMPTFRHQPVDKFDGKDR